jgi:sortase A
MNSDYRTNSFWLWAEVACLVVGFVLVGWWTYNHVATAVDQSWSNYELNASLRGEKPTLRGYAEEFLRPRSERAPTEIKPVPTPKATPQRTPPPAQGDLIGRIELPRLGISAIVRQGVDDATLSRAVGHVPQTALPGEIGNVGIAAHRDTHFRNLRGIKHGDTVRLVTPAGTYEYEVDSLKIVNPEDVHVLDATREPTITLVTCYPFNYVGHAPKRYIVQARQIGAAATTPETAATLESQAKVKKANRVPRGSSARTARSATD